MTTFLSDSNKVTEALSRIAFRRLLSVFTRYGESNYIGEAISIVSHSIQSGMLAAERFPEDKEFAAAALLHDIGHLLGMEAGMEMQMDGCGVVNHEGIGGDFLLSLGFSPRVAKLVRSHVAAKRYLCATNVDYMNALSEASKTTLRFQGGPMSEQECSEFASDEDFEFILQMRKIDEAAKRTDVEIPNFDSFESLLTNVPVFIGRPATLFDQYVLSPAQLQFWSQNGFLKLSNILDMKNIAVSDLDQWVEDIASWPKATNAYLQHYELCSVIDEVTGVETQIKSICRTENFVKYHKEMGNLVQIVLLNIASQLFGEQAVLFKEKVNYKKPGGGGFAAHQDTPAYIGLASDHISAMVAIDAATPENGCLQMAVGKWWVKDEVPLTSDGVITPEFDETIAYTPVTCVPGEVVFFGGYTPHRSGPNKSDRSRRAMFLTYNPLSQGDYHEQYYIAKHSGTQGFDGAHAISFQKDFQGTIID